MIRRAFTFAFSPLDCPVHSWFVRAGLVVLGIGAVIVLPVVL